MTNYDEALSSVIGELDSMKPVSVTGTLAEIAYTISTGCDALDVQLNGGLPGGRVVEFFGPTSSGKSLLALQAIANCQKQNGIALYLDVEGTTDSHFMEKIGVDLDRIYSRNPTTIEGIRSEIEIFIAYKQEVESKLREKKVISDNEIIPAIIVWDSVAATTASAAATKVESDGLDAVSVALQARQLSALFRDGKMSHKLSLAGVSLFLINQQRDKIGVLFGSSKTTFGGKAIPYYASIRVELQERTKLKINGEEVGIMVKARVEKSKVGSPFGEVKLCMIFNRGVHNALTTYHTLHDMKVITTSGGWSYLEINGEKHSFRRSDFASKLDEYRDEILEILATHGPNRKGVEIPDSTVEEVDDSYTD